MPEQSQIQLVVFDLGRVLLKIAADWHEAYDRAGLHHLEPQEGDISAGTRRKHDPEAERMFSGFETGKISQDDFFAFAAETGGMTIEEAKRLMDAWLIEPFDGVDEILDELKSAGLKLACLSNTNARHWESLTDPTHPAYLPLDKLDYPYASQLIGHAKPHPETYEYVERETSTPPHAILFFDDLEENIAAANERGWHTHHITPDRDPIQQVREVLSHHNINL